MWEKVHSLHVDFSRLFERKKGERSDCPRCKGSGLLFRPIIWQWTQSPSKVPCWFCEGIGAMPIIGLNGFIIAQAPSLLQRQDMNCDSRLPVQMHLCPGKFPGSRCKFSTYSPCQEPRKLLHDFGRYPVWLSGDSDSGHGNLQILPTNSRVAKSLAFPNQNRGEINLQNGRSSFHKPSSMMSASLEVQQSHRSLLEGLDHHAFGGASLQGFIKSTLCAMKSFENQKKPAKIRLTYLSHEKLDDFNGSPCNSRYTNCKTRMSQEPYPAVSHVCYHQNSAAFTVKSARKLAGVTYDANGSQLAKIQAADSVATSSKPGQPLFRSARKSRSSRKERNRIREEEVRKAAERAQRKKNSLIPLVKEPTIVNAGPKKDNMWWLGNQPWNEALFDIFGGKSLLKAVNFSPGASAEPQLLPDNIWTIQNFYTRFKEHTPLPLKPLKPSF